MRGRPARVLRALLLNAVALRHFLVILHAMNAQPDRVAEESKVSLDQVNVSLKVDRRLYERFNVATKTGHRSIAAEIRRLMEDRVNQFDVETAEEIPA